MRWEDERYVRIYTRDTVDWLGLSFLAQGLFCLLLRKVDRAGLLKLGKPGKRAVSIIIGFPGDWPRLEPALEELLDDGCVQIKGDVLLIPNFMEAQEAPQSDAQRKRESRARSRDLAAAADVLNPDKTSEFGTARHETGQKVTSGHNPSQVVTPNCAVPSVPSEPPSAPQRPDRPARLGVGHPAFEAVTHWRTKAWPVMSSAACPAVTEREASPLGRLCAEHGTGTVIAAMDRAAADGYWRDKLDLGTFVAKFARFLPRNGAGPAGAKPSPKVIGVDSLGQPVFAEDA